MTPRVTKTLYMYTIMHDDVLVAYDIIWGYSIADVIMELRAAGLPQRYPECVVKFYACSYLITRSTAQLELSE